MNENEIQLKEWARLDYDTNGLDELEAKLKADLEEQMADLNGLELDREKIGSPDSIGETIMNVVMEQVNNQIAAVAGEDFVKENGGLSLDLRDSAHIQTTENFAKGKIANHNTNIDYQKRYDDWQSNFQHDEKGNVITHTTRTGREEATLVSGARKPFDKGRPAGSVERGTDMDHTVSAGEIIRDPEANAHLTKEEQIGFANSDANLNEMDSSRNRSKGDNPTNEWLDNPNSKGQKPRDIYDISEEQEKQYREKDAEARAEYKKKKEEGEKRSVEKGKQSQKAEAFRIGGKALRAFIMSLLAAFLKDVIQKLIAWFRAGNQKIKTFIDSLEEAIKSFVSNLKQNLCNATETLLTTIATAIFGSIVGTIKKAWILLKQGYKSVKQAIDFLKNPANKDMPFSIKLLNVGKIVTTGLAAGGTILLSQVIEKSLMTIPVLAFEIPLLGSLANLIGGFSGALVCGLIGALALNMIDRMIAERMRIENDNQRHAKRNEIILTQERRIVVAGIRVAESKVNTNSNVAQRHADAGERFKDSQNAVERNSKESDLIHDSINKKNDDISNMLDNF